jgi:hypothetical protein
MSALLSEIMSVSVFYKGEYASVDVTGLNLEILKNLHLCIIVSTGNY